MENPTKHCRHCGGALDPHAQFCQSCGKSVEKADPPSGKPPPVSLPPSTHEFHPALGILLGFLVVALAAAAIWFLWLRPPSLNPVPTPSLASPPATASATVPHPETVTPTPIAVTPTPTNVQLTGFNLRIQSSPGGASVIIDGRDTGQRTPFSDRLPPGVYKLELRLAGYQPWQESVLLEDKDRVLAITLHPLLPVTVSPTTVMGTPSSPWTPSTFTPTSPETADTGLLYADDFSDPRSGWAVDSDDSSSYRYQDGYYEITVIPTNWTVWSYPRRSFDDFSLIVQASQQGGPDNNEYGVILRLQDGDNFYCYVVSGDGFYAFFKKVNGERQALIDWTNSPAIRQGQATNELRVSCLGQAFTLWANGSALGEVKDSTFAAGDIGLLAGSFEEGNVRIAFDDLQVWTATGPASIPRTTTPSAVLLLEDDFSDPGSGWPAGSYPDRSMSYADGQYKIDVYEKNWGVTSWLAGETPGDENLLSMADCLLEVEATERSGPDNNGYGLLFRLEDGDNFYLFGVSGKGTYFVYKKEAGKWQTLINSTESAAVYKGKATNRLQVACRGDTFTFFLNGQKLESLRDGTFARGMIGFYAESTDQPGVQIRFDNLKVWALP